MNCKSSLPCRNVHGGKAKRQRLLGNYKRYARAKCCEVKSKCGKHKTPSGPACTAYIVCAGYCILLLSVRAKSPLILLHMLELEYYIDFWIHLRRYASRTNTLKKKLLALADAPVEALGLEALQAAEDARDAEKEKLGCELEKALLAQAHAMEVLEERKKASEAFFVLVLLQQFCLSCLSLAHAK